MIVDEFIESTCFRHAIFRERFEPGLAAHAPTANPFSAAPRASLVANATDLRIRHHEKGTVVTIEGPRFSTRAESNGFRAWAQPSSTCRSRPSTHSRSTPRAT